MAKGAGLRAVTTLARIAGRRLLRGASKPADPMAFEAALKMLLARPAMSTEIKEIRFIEIDADTPGWSETGLALAPGEEVTVFAAGAFWASKALDMYFGARIGLWLRAGEKGRAVKTPSNAATVRLAEGGPLYIVAKPPGEFLDEQGTFDPAFPRGGLTGGLRACLITWAHGAARGLDALAAEGDWHGLVARARDRVHAPVATPSGWNYLWRLGQGEIYSDVAGEHGRHIHCRTHEDVGILQFPADFPLTDKTELRWRWKVDRLPIDLPEDIQPTHDYLSIAVEFDNGQDLTYMWSASLEEGTIFRCPLPYWDKVETHWVLRSKPSDLGRWLAEARPVKADYARAVGAPPARIVRVWLIAVSVFQRGEGICDYADIELVDGERRLKVL